MKLQTRLAILFFLLLSGRLLAAPLSGVYTIGGSSPSYNTFTLAVAALTTNGVSGAVVFNVRPGAYNEQITIPSITGVNASNTVTFQSSTGVAGDVTLSYAATGTVNNWVVKLNGATYIIFNKITLQATGTTYSRVVTMYNASQWDTVKNCVLNAPVATTSNLNQVVIDAGDDGTNSYYNGFYNDTINNGSYGFYTAGTGSCYVRYLLVKDNVFLNQYAYGICNNGCLWGLLKNNIITTNSNDTSYYGIYINIAIDSIDGNKITNCPGNGIWWDNGAPNIFNNFIELTGTAATYGLTFTDMNESGTTSEIAYNTVLVLNTNPNSSAFYIPTGYDQPLNFVQDNVFINRGGGYAANIVETGEVSNPNGWGITSLYDYNDYYTTGTYIGNWGGTNCTTFANWQTTISSCNCGGDSHSNNINPSFVSNSDLHITVDNLRFGHYDPRVLWDIDGETRNITTPDVGADEFDSTQAAALQANFTANKTNICSGSTVHFTDESTGSPTKWRWTFTGGTTDTSTSQNPSVSYDSAGTYTVKLAVGNTGGADSLVKTGYIIVTASPVAGLIMANPDTVCSGDSSRLSAAGSSGPLQWQSSLSGTNYTDVNNADSSAYTVSSPSQTAFYRLVATNVSCTADTSGILRLVVNPLPAPIVISTDSIICASDSALVQTTASYTSYLWNNTDTGSHIYANAAGAYWVTVTDTNGCSATSNHVNIAVYPVPSVSVVQNGDTLSSFGAIAYQWYMNDTIIPGATDYIYVGRCFIPYSIQIIDSNGCTARSNQLYLVCEGISEVNDNNRLSIYPNPFNNIVSAQVLVTNSGIKEIQIFDVLGRLTVDKDFNNTSVNLQTMNVSVLPQGLYFIKVTMNTGEQYSQKIIKQ